MKNGGVLHDNEKVLNIIPGEVCAIVTNKQTYKSKAVIIAAGKILK